MNPRRMAIEMWPTLVFGGGIVVLLGCIGSAENAAVVRVVDRLAPSLAANATAAFVPPRAAPTPAVSSEDVAMAAELLAELAVDPKARDKQQPEMPSAGEQPSVVVAALSDPAEVLSEELPEVPEAVNPTTEGMQTAEKQKAENQQPVVVATLGDPAEVLPQETAVQASTAAGVADPSPAEAANAPDRIELVGECRDAEACIDQFLWALYERTPKQDTTKERERRKVTVRNKKGKLVKVTKTFTRLVNNDFTWKDPKAAERVGMSMIDYVIGGMDKSFKMKLFYMLYAAERAGLAPGITSAFRDDYRQSIATGMKAASDRSYHGGSFRGGYGHGLAADIVSTKGATRAQRWVSTEALWKWVDANGKDFGIGRPYLDRDPPHVGPIDGPEYVSKRGAPKAADAKKPDGKAAQQKPAAPRRPVADKSSKARSS